MNWNLFPILLLLLLPVSGCLGIGGTGENTFPPPKLDAPAIGDVWEERTTFPDVRNGTKLRIEPKMLVPFPYGDREVVPLKCIDCPGLRLLDGKSGHLLGFERIGKSGEVWRGGGGTHFGHGAGGSGVQYAVFSLSGVEFPAILTIGQVRYEFTVVGVNEFTAIPIGSLVYDLDARSTAGPYSVLGYWHFKYETDHWIASELDHDDKVMRRYEWRRLEAGHTPLRFEPLSTPPSHALPRPWPPGELYADETEATGSSAGFTQAEAVRLARSRSFLGDGAQIVRSANLTVRKEYVVPAVGDLPGQIWATNTTWVIVAQPVGSRDAVRFRASHTQPPVGAPTVTVSLQSLLQLDVMDPKNLSLPNVDPLLLYEQFRKADRNASYIFAELVFRGSMTDPDPASDIEEVLVLDGDIVTPGIWKWAIYFDGPAPVPLLAAPPDRFFGSLWDAGDGAVLDVAADFL